MSPIKREVIIGDCRLLLGDSLEILPRLGKAIFVHGCFWHMHSKCSACRFPKTRRAWWKKKLLR